ncbi:Pseudouridine synthase, Rsu [Histomonas meleagridis]|uniref:Pseudouridine synthase, Rsu n=1 Tax=Histomonas meleagridis TaxID=135588 RepID=UPI0035599F04|nr:Pseudouridine synthase, Rsu [Histomonas meleagridis]KAH0806260.1 Pseudouridine synthase, Rsu [Histomonas meleagridis]
MGPQQTNGQNRFSQTIQNSKNLSANRGFNPRDDKRDNEGNIPYNNGGKNSPSGNRFNDDRYDDTRPPPFDNRKPYDDNDRYGDRRPPLYDDRKPYSDDRYDDRRRPYDNDDRYDDGRRPYDNDDRRSPPFDDRKPYNNDRYDDRRSPPYDDRRPHDDDRYDDQRPPPYDDRFDDRKPYDDNDRFDDRRSPPYDDRRSPPNDDRRPYDDDRYDDRRPPPYDDRFDDRKPYDDDDRFDDRRSPPRDGRSSPPYDDRRKPYNDDNDRYDDRRSPPYDKDRNSPYDDGKPPYDDSRSPFNDRPVSDGNRTPPSGWGTPNEGHTPNKDAKSPHDSRESPRDARSPPANGGDSSASNSFIIPSMPIEIEPEKPRIQPQSTRKPHRVQPVRANSKIQEVMLRSSIFKPNAPMKPDPLAKEEFAQEAIQFLQRYINVEKGVVLLPDEMPEIPDTVSPEMLHALEVAGLTSIFLKKGFEKNSEPFIDEIYSYAVTEMGGLEPFTDFIQNSTEYLSELPNLDFGNDPPDENELMENLKLKYFGG